MERGLQQVLNYKSRNYIEENRLIQRWDIKLDITRRKDELSKRKDRLRYLITLHRAVGSLAQEIEDVSWRISTLLCGRTSEANTGQATVPVSATLNVIIRNQRLFLHNLFIQQSFTNEEEKRRFSASEITDGAVKTSRVCMYMYVCMYEPGSSVSIVSGYGLDDRAI
jgi:hypothetical protein